MGKNKGISKLAFVLSVAALVLAGVVSVFKLENLWLAGTQWILVSIIFAVYAVFLGLCDCECCKSKEGEKTEQ